MVGTKYSWFITFFAILALIITFAIAIEIGHIGSRQAFLTPYSESSSVTCGVSNYFLSYTYGEGFKEVNGKHVLLGSRGVVYLTLEPSCYYRPRRHVLIIYSKTHFSEVKEKLIRYYIVEGLMHNSTQLLSEAEYYLFKAFPLEFKAYIISGSKTTTLYLFKLEQGTKLIIPIIVEVFPLKLAKKHVIVAEIIDEVSSYNVSGKRIFISLNM